MHRVVVEYDKWAVDQPLYILISQQLITQKIPVADTSKQNIRNIAGVLYSIIYF